MREIILFLLTLMALLGLLVIIVMVSDFKVIGIHGQMGNQDYHSSSIETDATSTAPKTSFSRQITRRSLRENVLLNKDAINHHGHHHDHSVREKGVPHHHEPWRSLEVVDGLKNEHVIAVVTSSVKGNANMIRERYAIREYYSLISHCN